MEEAEVPGKRQAFAYKFQVSLCSSVYFTCSLGFLSFKIRYHQMCISHFLYILLKNMFIWRKKGISKNAEMRMCAIFFLSLKFWKPCSWLMCASWIILQVRRIHSIIHSVNTNSECLSVLVPGTGKSVNNTSLTPAPPSYCWQSRHFTYIIYNTHNSSC